MATRDEHRPSARAVAALADDVGATVGDLRTDLRSALDRATAHEEAGRPDLAVAVLEEQRSALAAVHARLEERLAAAAVESEAEAVVARVDTPVRTTGAVRPGPGRATSVGLRVLATAAAVTFGILVVVVPDPGAGALGAAGDATTAPDATGERPDVVALRALRLPVVPRQTRTAAAPATDPARAGGDGLLGGVVGTPDRDDVGLDLPLDDLLDLVQDVATTVDAVATTQDQGPGDAPAASTTTDETTADAPTGGSSEPATTGADSTGQTAPTAESSAGDGTSSSPEGEDAPDADRRGTPGDAAATPDGAEGAASTDGSTDTDEPAAGTNDPAATDDAGVADDVADTPSVATDR